MPRVGTGASRGVEDPAGGVSHVGLVGFRLDFQLLDGFHRGRDRRPIGQVGDRHALDQVAVAAARAAAERERRRTGLILVAHELRIAGLNDARCRDRREEGVAPEDGQGSQRVFVERGRLRCAHTLDERCFTGHGQLLGDRPHFEREVEHRRLLRADAKSCSLLGLEARERHSHGIRAGQHAGHDVLADFIRHRRALAVRVFVDERHFGAGDHALNVSHDPAQRALVGLRSCDCRAGEQECCSAGHTPLRLVQAHKGNSLRLICAFTECAQALGASPVPRIVAATATDQFPANSGGLRTFAALRARRHARITDSRVRVGRVERTKMKLPQIDAANHRQSCS